jgi:hypothetical protein
MLNYSLRAPTKLAQGVGDGRYPAARTASTCEVQAGHRVAASGIVVTQ